MATRYRIIHAGNATSLAGINGAITNGSITVNSSGVSINLPAYLTTAMASNASSVFAGVGETTGTTSGTDMKMTVDTAGVNISFPKWLTTAMASDNGSVFVQANATIAGTNVSGTIASNGISLSAVAGGGGAAIKGSGTYSQNTGTVEFANSNGITFGLSNNGTMTASHNGLTTAMASNASSLFAGIGETTATTSGTDLKMTVDTAGVNISFPKWITTARASNDAVGLNTALTANGVAWTVNSSGISLNVPAFLTTAMASNRGTDFVQANATIAGTNISGTIASNVISLSVGAGGAGGAGVGETTGTTSGTDLKLTVDTDGVNISFPKWITTAAQSDHSHGNPTLNLTNLSGTTASASNGFTLSLSAGRGGETLSAFEPFYLANPISTTFAPNIGTWYVQPFVAPQAIASGRLNVLASFSNSSNALVRLSTGNTVYSSITGTADLSYAFSTKIALYSRGAGTNSTRIDSFWSSQWTIGVTENVSIEVVSASRASIKATVQLGYIASVGSNGGTTGSTLTTAGASSNAGTTLQTIAAMSSLFTESFYPIMSGANLIPIPFDTSISAGQYWLAQMYSTASTTAGSSLPNLIPVVNKVGIYGLSSMIHRPYGATNSNSSSQYFPGAGAYSVASADPPSSMIFADIRSIASNITQYFNIMNITV